MDALEVDPKNGYVWRQVGVMAVLGNEKYRALECFENGWKYGDSVSFKVMVQMLLATNQFEKVKTLLPELVSKISEDPEIRFEIIYYIIRSKDYDSELFGKAVFGLSDEIILKQTNRNIQTLIDGFELFKKTEEAERLKALLKKRKSEGPKEEWIDIK